MNILKEILKELVAIRVGLQNINDKLEPIKSIPEDSDGEKSDKERVS